jgi:hypothetical protein
MEKREKLIRQQAVYLHYIEDNYFRDEKNNGYTLVVTCNGI